MSAVYLGKIHLDRRNTENYLGSIGLPIDLYYRQAELTSLSISREIGDLRWLSSNSLNELHIDSLAFNDLGMLGNLENLKILDLGNSTITTLASAPLLPELEILVLGSEINQMREFLNKNDDATFVQRLNDHRDFYPFDNLDRPNMVRRPLSNLGGLRSFPNLKYLDLSGTRVSSVEFLANVPQITILDMTGSDLRTLTNMPAMENLEALSVRHTLIETTAGLSNAPNIQYLDISGTPIKVFDDLTSMQNLKYLFASNSKFDDLQLLRNNSNLEYLDLSGSELSDLNGIDYFFNIRGLSIGGIPMTNLRGLSALPKLSYLSLSEKGRPSLGQSPKNVDGASSVNPSMLPRLNALHRLDLTGQIFSDFDWLSNTPSLEELVLRDMMIDDFATIPTNETIVELVLSNSHIRSFAGLSKLKGLRRLIIDNVVVSGIDNIEPMHSVAEFSVSEVSWPDNTPLSATESSKIVDSFRGLISLRAQQLHELPDTPSLESLTVSDIEDWDGLERFVGLRTLETSRFGIGCLDVPWMVRGASVTFEETVIWCGGTGYRLMSGGSFVIIASATAKTVMYRGEPAVEDPVLKAIGASSQLEFLGISGRYILADRIKSIGANIKQLDISFAGIENFDFFATMTSLEKLKMRGFDRISSSIFVRLDNLREIDLRGTTLLEMKDLPLSVKILSI